MRCVASTSARGTHAILGLAVTQGSAQSRKSNANDDSQSAALTRVQVNYREAREREPERCRK